MRSMQLTVTSAILIILAFNSILLGYLASKTAYTMEVLQKNQEQNAKILNETHTVAIDSRHILINQIALITHNLNQALNNTEDERLKTSEVINRLNNLTKINITK